jgi:hypothetical protein
VAGHDVQQTRNHRANEAAKACYSRKRCSPKNYRLIHTAIWRIEQQGIYVAESSSNPAHLAGAEEVLACMVRGRQQLSLRRGKVRLIGPVF